MALPLDSHQMSIEIEVINAFSRNINLDPLQKKNLKHEMNY